MKARSQETLSAAEAANRLGVKTSTLYSYVSRGLLPRSRDSDRRSRFALIDLERLEQGRPVGLRLAPRALSSGITAVRDGALYFRGRDAIELARQLEFEAAAEWLWTGSDATPPPWLPNRQAVRLGRSVQRSLPASALPLDRLRVAAPAVALADPLRYEVRPQAVVLSGRHLISSMVLSLPPVGAAAARTEPFPGVTRALWQRLCPQPCAPDGERALAAALVLLLDHELSLSTLAARLAASIGADPYAVISVGLSALGGPFHAVASLAAEDLLAEIGGPGATAEVIGSHLRRGDRLPGFGHRLHPHGDPRATLLLRLARASASAPSRWEVVQEVLAVTAQHGLPAPNVDFALAALAASSEMVRGASEAIFAVARCAGWIAHALEAYRSSWDGAERSQAGPER